jgi:hypothetical protein
MWVCGGGDPCDEARPGEPETRTAEDEDEDD